MSMTELLCRMRIADELEPAMRMLTARQAKFQRELEMCAQLEGEIASLTAEPAPGAAAAAWRRRSMPPAVAREAAKLSARERLVEADHGRYSRVALDGERFLVRVGAEVLVECEDAGEALRLVAERKRWLSFHLHHANEQARGAAAETRHLLALAGISEDQVDTGANAGPTLERRAVVHRP